jgi:hypothetical protein
MGKGHGPRPKRGIDKAGALGRLLPRQTFTRYGASMEWSTPRRPVRLPAGFIEPCNPTFSTKAPSSLQWIHERMMAMAALVSL